jgi:hypothetical protein
MPSNLVIQPKHVLRPAKRLALTSVQAGSQGSTALIQRSIPEICTPGVFEPRKPLIIEGSPRYSLTKRN